MPKLLLGLVVLLYGIPALALDDIKVIDESNNLAVPVLVVPPNIPSSAPDSVFPVHLEMRGTVTEAGVFENVEFAQSAGNEAFIASVKEVLEHWRFKPAISLTECRPVASKARVDVYFEIVDGMKKIFISSAKREDSAAVDKYAWTKRTYEQWARKLPYPEDALRDGVEGHAEIMFLVNNKGEVLSRNLIEAIPYESFGTALMVATNFVKFSEGAAGERNMCISVPAQFCLGARANVRHSGCGHP